MAHQLEYEQSLVGDATTMVLLKEMWLIPSNRKRALISVALMICQQMTGVNAVVGLPLSSHPLPLPWNRHCGLQGLELLRPSNLQRPRPGRLTCLAPRNWRVRHRQGRRLPMFPPLRRRLSRPEEESPLDQRRAGHSHVPRRRLRTRAAAYRGRAGELLSLFPGRDIPLPGSAGVPRSPLSFTG